VKISRIAPLFALTLTLGGAVAARDGGAPFRGTFTVSPADLDGYVELHVEHRSPGHHSSSSFDLRASELRGYSETADGPVRMELVRDAGTLVCEGTLRRGEGGGSALLTPSADYLAEMARLGYGDVTDRAVSLFLHDVSRTFVRDLASLGYPHVGLEDLLRLRIHGATAAFVRELQSLGYSHVEVEDLVRLRIHGATADWVRNLRDAGYTHLSVDDLIRMRIHGVTSEFVAELKDLGYTRVEGEDLVRMRIHGVTTEMVRELKSLGYANVPVEDLVRMRIHGVTPEYVKSFQASGYENLSVEELVSMRIHGVTPELARAARRR